MLKTELVAAVAVAAALTRRQASEVVDCFIEQVTNALARGDHVALQGFGRFQLKHHPQRSGRHPKTGEPIVIAAQNSVQFKPASHLKSACLARESNSSNPSLQ